jgi:hypothetical protein
MEALEQQKTGWESNLVQVSFQMVLDSVNSALKIIFNFFLKIISF